MKSQNCYKKQALKEISEVDSALKEYSKASLEEKQHELLLSFAMHTHRIWENVEKLKNFKFVGENEFKMKAISLGGLHISQAHGDYEHSYKFIAGNIGEVKVMTAQLKVALNDFKAE